MRISGVPVRKKMGPSQLSAESENRKKTSQGVGYIEEEEDKKMVGGGTETKRKLFFLLQCTPVKKSGGN